MTRLADRVRPGLRVRRSLRWGGTAGKNRIGTVIGLPVEQRRGHWYVDVLWDGSAVPETVYLSRLEAREAP